MTKNRRGDALAVVAVCIFVLAVILIIAVIGSTVYDTAYRSGQIDALTGRVLWEQITMQDGRTGWIESGKDIIKVYRIEEKPDA